MTVIDNVNKMSKYGLRRKPTYAEIIGMLDDNEKITGKLPNRDATFFKSSPEGSFFDGSDAMEQLREEQGKLLLKQSPYPQADKLPFRSIIVSASQGGKGILIQNLILKIYRGCFERIYIVSPTAHIDEAYKEVIRYIEKELKIDNKKEQYLFDEYDPESLAHIIDTQHKVIEYQKKNKRNKLYSCLLVVDDFAEDKTFMRYSKILYGLYTKSRHFGLSVITATQKYNALSPIVRLNSSSLYIFKLKNQSELDTFIQEQSALIDKKTINEIYRVATEEPYSFLFVKLRESDVNKIFMKRFEAEIHIQ